MARSREAHKGVWVKENQIQDERHVLLDSQLASRSSRLIANKDSESNNGKRYEKQESFKQTQYSSIYKPNDDFLTMNNAKICMRFVDLFSKRAYQRGLHQKQVA